MTNAMTRLTRIKKNKLLKLRRWEHAAGLMENHFFFLEHPLDDNGEITKIYTRYANSLSTDGLHRKHWQILSFRQMLILFFFLGRKMKKSGMYRADDQVETINNNS